jgi:hypothetical protein
MSRKCVPSCLRSLLMTPYKNKKLLATSVRVPGGSDKTPVANNNQFSAWHLSIVNLQGRNLLQRAIERIRCIIRTS